MTQYPKFHNRMMERERLLRRLIKDRDADRKREQLKAVSNFGVWNVPANVRIVDDGKIEGE